MVEFTTYSWGFSTVS